MAPQPRVSVTTRTFKTGSKYTRTGAHRSKYSSRRYGKAKIGKPLKRAIQAMISKDAETKYVINSSNYTSYNAQVNGSEALRIMPQISNGTGGNQKIGNKIQLQKLSLRGVLSMQLNQTTANNTRFGVRLTMLRLKKFDDWQAANTDLATNFNKLLEGTLIGMDGSVVAYNTPLNLDYCTKIFDKKIYMTLPAVASGSQVQDAPTHSCKLLNFTIPFSKRVLNYDENNSSTEPVDYPYFMLISYCKLDGTGAAPAAGESLLQFQYTIKAEFEDA